jgi:hypothetical protein
MSRLASLVSLFVLAAASSPPREMECTLTMSGAHAAAAPCTARLGYERGRDVSALTITGQGVHLVVRVRGSVSATRFSSADATSGAALGVHLENGAYWYYNRDFGARGKPAAGNYELVLTAVNNGADAGRSSDGGGNTEARGSASGTLTAALPSGRVGGGVLTVTVRFQ